MASLLQMPFDDEDDDESEWIPMSQQSTEIAEEDPKCAVTDAPTPSIITTPATTTPKLDDDVVLVDVDNNANVDAGMQTLSDYGISIVTPTNDCISNASHFDSSSSQWVTRPPKEEHFQCPTTTKTTPSITNNGHSNSNSQWETAAARSEPSQIMPPSIVHRYRGSLKIKTQCTPRHFNNNHINGIDGRRRNYTIMTKHINNNNNGWNVVSPTVSDDGSSMKSGWDDTSDLLLVNGYFIDQSDSVDNDNDIDDLDDQFLFLGDIDEVGCIATPLDDKLEDMTVIVNKRLDGISISECYDICWSNEKGKPFYKSWLQERGNNDVVVRDWRSANTNDDVGYVGSWCGETYTHKRLVTFKYRQISELHSGSLEATVQQSQLCRCDNDRFVMTMQIKHRGIPFDDHFHVHVRWVVMKMPSSTTTTTTTDQLLVKVGVVVDLVQPTLLAGTLQSEIMEATRQEQLHLFKTMKTACKEYQRSRDTTTIIHPIGFHLPTIAMHFLNLLDPNNNNNKKHVSTTSGIQPKCTADDLRQHITRADTTLRQISTLLVERERSSKDHHQENGKDDTRNQLETVNQLLDQIKATLQK